MKKLIAICALTICGALHMEAAPKTLPSPTPLKLNTIEFAGIQPWDDKGIYFWAFYGYPFHLSFGIYLGSYHGGFMQLPWWYPGPGQTETPVVLVEQKWTNPETEVTLVYDGGKIITVFLPEHTEFRTGTYYFVDLNTGSTYFARHDHQTGSPDLTPEQAMVPAHLARQAPPAVEEKSRIQGTVITYHNPTVIEEVLYSPAITGPTLSEWVIDFTVIQPHEVKFNVYFAIAGQEELVRADKMEFYVKQKMHSCDLFETQFVLEELPFSRFFEKGKYQVRFTIPKWPIFGGATP